MKRAVIIGATSGIGKCIAQKLIKEHYIVGITGRRKDLLDALTHQEPDCFFPQVLDIRNTESLVESIEDLVLHIGGLDLLILSSGTGDLNDELTFDIEKNTIETNVLGFTCIVTWAFNYFQNQKKGHLVVISSVGGLRGSRAAPAYNATKAYQINYLEGLRQKVNKLNIEMLITDVRPGFVDTAMAKGDGQFWVAPIEKASNQILNAIKRKRKIVYVTKRWRIIGLILKMMPRIIYDKF
jgi:short-subunit dehydrogenase